jgi:hypothetical protein
MKMRNLTLILCGLFATFQLSAQETNQDVKRFKITSFAFGFGGYSQQLPRLSVSDFKTLAPESLILSSDIGDFSSGYSSTSPGGSSFTALLEISKRNKDKTGYSSGPIFRVGLNYLGGMGISNHIQMEQRTPYDTLYSGNSGIISYVDSVREQRYEMNYRSNHLQLDLSAIWRSKSKSLLSVYAGVGVSAGLSVYTETTINYNDKRYTSQYQTENESLIDSRYGSYDWDQQESTLNNQNFAIQMFMPLGVALKLGKKRELFRNLHLFTELRPGIGYYQIPELNAGFTRPFYQQFFGFRYQVE